MKTTWIETISGIKFNPFNVALKDIRIIDIAHSLSLITRFNGHCKFFYSVAQHSINVAKALEKMGYNENIVLYGLLHDSAEAYLGDIPRPIKPAFKNYEQYESQLQSLIWQAFNIEKPIEEVWDIVKSVDNAMLKCEALALTSNIDGWANSLPDNNVALNTIIEYKDMNVVEQQFLQYFDNLSRYAECNKYKQYC